MACELPFVKGGAPSGFGMWDGPGMQDAAKAHPFDRPFNVMKALQAELHELRAAAEQESRRREAEAARLQAEVTELQKGLAEERAQRAVSCDGVKHSLGVELAQLRKALQEARLEAAAGLQEHRKLAVGDLDAVRAQFAGLRDTLGAERGERRALAKELSGRIDAGAASHDSLAAKLTRDLDDHVQRIGDLQAKDRERMEELVELHARAAQQEEVLHEKHTEWSVPVEDLVRGISARAETMEKSIEDFKASTASAIREHWKTTTVDIGELRTRIERQCADLAGELDRERRERGDVIQALRPQVQANEESARRALVRVEHLTSGHMGNPRSRSGAVSLEDRGGDAAKLVPRPPPQPRERRPEAGPLSSREFFP